jgi:Rho GTPase-activating protein 1
LNAGNNANANGEKEGKTSLGQIIKLCIERYYEIFDEMYDRAEAVPVSRSVLGVGGAPFAATTSTDNDLAGRSSSSSGNASEVEVEEDDDEGEIDDGMLVMPIGPTMTTPPGSAGPSVTTTPGGNGNGRVSPRMSPTVGKKTRAPPSAWTGPGSPAGASSANATLSSSPNPSPTSNLGSVSGRSTSKFVPRHRTNASLNSIGIQSMFTPSSPSPLALSASASGSGSGSSFHGGTIKAKSMISVEKSSSGDGTIGGKGTMRAGRGSIRLGSMRGKTTGAGVEAVGVTASGFFTPPSAAEGDGQTEVGK